MATIQSTLSLQDSMSGTLKTITTALNSTLSAMKSIEGVKLGPEFAQAASDIKLAERSLETMNMKLNDFGNNQAPIKQKISFLELNAVLDLSAKAFNIATNMGSTLLDAAAGVSAEIAMFDQTFKEMGSSASEAIRGIAESSNILETRLNTAGARIFGFAKASGATAPQALDLMERALQASADSAAYYDKSLDETTDTMMSFLKGNFANDAALGVSATEFTRNAMAAQLFGNEYRNLTEVQKQQTLLQMVIDAQELSGAMGQAAREADGWENVQGNLNEAWRQFNATAGQPILESLIPIVQGITYGLLQLKDAINWDYLIPIVLGLASAIMVFAGGMAIYTAVTWLSVAANQALIITLLSNPLLWIAILIGVVVAAIYHWVQAVGGIDIAWAIVVDNLIYSWDIVKIAFFTGINWVINLFDKMMFDFALISFGITNIMMDMKTNTLVILQDLVNGAISIINDFIKALNVIPGVNLEVIENVTFGAKASAQNEADKQSRAANINAKFADVNAKIAGRESAINEMKSNTVKDRTERQLKIAEMPNNSAGSLGQTSLGQTSPGAFPSDVISGSGSNAALKTKNTEPLLSEEDIKLLSDIATRDYQLNYKQITPEIYITTGDIRETADVNTIVKKIADGLEEMASSRLEVAT
jgi:hypothetical protein